MVGFLILLLVIGFFLFWGMVLFGTLGVMSVDEKRTRKALEDEPALNAAFFDGKPTVVFETPGNGLPPKVVIEAAPQHGYRLVNQSEGQYNKTLVFERVN